MDVSEPENLGFCHQRLNRIEPKLKAYIDNGDIVGISTLVARRGQVVHRSLIGLMDTIANTPITTDAIFRVYSMTKPVICTALMMLHEEGRFHLDQPISQYLPQFTNQKVLITGGNTEKLVPVNREILIKDLFTHTSGLSYTFLADAVAEKYRTSGLLTDASVSLADTVQSIANHPLLFHPGERWHYSVSIDVLAHLIEVLSCCPLGDFLQDRVFKPLGMDQSGFEVEKAQISDIADIFGNIDLLGKDVGFDELISATTTEPNKLLDLTNTYPYDNPNHARGGHGLFMTIDDYFRFAQMLLNGGELYGNRVLGRKTVELMHCNHLPLTLLPFGLNDLVMWTGYGFGLGSRVCIDPAQTNLTGSVGEFGWAGAAKTYYWVDPREEIIGIFMSQRLSYFQIPERDFQALVYQALVD